MLELPSPRRQSGSRSPFRCSLFDEHHPEFLRLEHSLPADNPARLMPLLVSRLDLDPLRLSYQGRGSLAFPTEPLLAFVLFMFHCGILSPAAWARSARFDDRCKWLLRGLLPSRSQLYSFRDRLEPFLDAWHKQLLDWAIVEGITSASRGSLDGTFVASWASRCIEKETQRTKA